MAQFASEADVAAAMKKAIEDGVPDSTATVTVNGGGHYALEVRSPAFEGKKLVDKQRLVYSQIAHLMAGNDAPVHAIDSMKTVV